VRAQLHERFALWLEEHGADLVELDEIVGYHLEQAYRYRAELGPLDEAASAIAWRSAKRLLRSAERARYRGDGLAADLLLGRAVDLLPAESAERRAAQATRAQVVSEIGEFAAAADLRDEAEAAARAAGDEALLGRLVLSSLEAQIQADSEATMRGSLAAAEEAYAALERLGDEYGAVWALRLIGNFQGWLGDSRESEQTWRRALERAERVDPRLRDEILIWLAWQAWWGPDSTEEGLRRCDEYLERARRTGSKRLEGVALNIRGILQAYRGSFEEARRDIKAGRALLKDLGDRIWWAGPAMLEGEIELVAGDPLAAYETLAEGHRALAELAETGYLATIVGLQAQAALDLRREEEALELADETERLAQKDDFEPRARLHLVRALVHARRGDLDRAGELVRQAADLIESTDYLYLHVHLNLVRAEVAGLAGERDAEREALERALAAAEEKRCLVAVDQIRERLAGL
jgi:hypothetical protein